MTHSFDVDLAIKYGVINALLLNHIEYWCLKNEANNKHFHNGRYWMYNSQKGFAKMFPYLTERQIDYGINKLKEQNLILVDNFNYSKMNRTLWYALSDFGISILQNCKMEKTKLSNASNEIVGHIYNNSNYNSIISSINNSFSDENLINALVKFIETRDKIKKPLDDYSFNLLLDKLKRLGKTPEEQLKIVEQSIIGQYPDFYPLSGTKAKTTGKSLESDLDRVNTVLGKLGA